jgi:hypothetical protein
MTAASLLDALAARGVTLWADGGALRFRPAAAVPEELRSLLRAAKPELMRLLAVVETDGDQADEDQLDDGAGDDLDGVLELPRVALRGTFGEVVEYLSPATGANAAHVFAATWTALAASIGAHRWGTWSGRVVPATFALMCGPTGDHKSTAARHVLDLLPAAVKRVDGTASDAGLFDALEDAEGAPVLWHADELGFLLKMQAMSGSMLDAMLNILWTGPACLDRNLSRRNKDGGGPRRIEKPFLCLLGGTHATTFWRYVGDPILAIGSGFVNRLAVFAVERGRSLAITDELDPETGAEIRAHLERLTRLDDRALALDAPAVRRWRDYSVAHDERLHGLAQDVAAVTKRVRDHVARLALTFAADRGAHVVDLADLDAAIEVGSYLEASYRALLGGRQPDRGPARARSLEETVRRLLGRVADRWCSARELQRSWPSGDVPSAIELRRIIEAMDGVERSMPSKGKPRYRLPRKGGGPTLPDTRHSGPNCPTPQAKYGADYRPTDLRHSPTLADLSGTVGGLSGRNFADNSPSLKEETSLCRMSESVGGGATGGEAACADPITEAEL